MPIADITLLLSVTWSCFWLRLVAKSVHGGKTAAVTDVRRGHLICGGKFASIVTSTFSVPNTRNLRFRSLDLDQQWYRRLPGPQVVRLVLELPQRLLQLTNLQTADPLSLPSNKFLSIPSLPYSLCFSKLVQRSPLIRRLTQVTFRQNHPANILNKQIVCRHTHMLLITFSFVPSFPL